MTALLLLIFVWEREKNICLETTSIIIWETGKLNVSPAVTKITTPLSFSPLSKGLHLVHGPKTSIIRLVPSVQEHKRNKQSIHDHFNAPL